MSKWRTYCQLGDQILSWENGYFGVFFALPEPKTNISRLLKPGKPMIFRKYEVFPCFCNRNDKYSVKQEALIILSERCPLFVTKTLKCNLCNLFLFEHQPWSRAITISALYAPTNYWHYSFSCGLTLSTSWNWSVVQKEKRRTFVRRMQGGRWWNSLCL